MIEIMNSIFILFESPILYSSCNHLITLSCNLFPTNILNLWYGKKKKKTLILCMHLSRHPRPLLSMMRLIRYKNRCLSQCFNCQQESCRLSVKWFTFFFIFIISPTIIKQTQYMIKSLKWWLPIYKDPKIRAFPQTHMANEVKNPSF